MDADEKAESRNISKVNAEEAAKVKAEEPDQENAPRHEYDKTRKHEMGGPAKPRTSTNPSRRINAPRKTGAS